MFKSFLPHFCVGRIFISYSYGLSGSNPCHYGFPNLNKLLTPLIFSFLLVFRTLYAYALQILLVRQLKLFVTLWMFTIAKYAHFFNFHNLKHIPWNNIFIGYNNLPWFSLSRLTLSLKKPTHELLTHISLYVV
jgi:hypothetical protein